VSTKGVSCDTRAHADTGQYRTASRAAAIGGLPNNTHLPLGGEGSWDYLVPDAPNHRIFIGSQNRVMVVDEDKGTLLVKSPASRAPTGRRSRYDGHGFATRANDESVVMFDLKTFKVLDENPRRGGCRCDHLRPASMRVFTLNGDATHRP